MSRDTDDMHEGDLAALRARAKAEIRRHMRSIRGVLPVSACGERATRATERLLALPEVARARTVVAYVAMRKEIDPGALCAALRAQGKTVALPRIDGEALALHEFTSDEALVENELGVREPPLDAPRVVPEAVDVIVVPALAIDPRGYRVGYGGGFYDRLLPTLPNAFKVGLVYDFQLIAEAPNDTHDVPVDCLVSDARVMRSER